MAHWDGEWEDEDEGGEWQYKLPKIHHFRYNNIIRETEKAILFDIVNDDWYKKELKNVWFPKKLLDIKNKNLVFTDLWLYKKKIHEQHPKVIFVTILE